MKPQRVLDFSGPLQKHEELAVDLFAGGGGLSVAYKMATRREIDIAINHDPAAIAMHAANHPKTKHIVSDVFEVSPRKVTEGRPVGYLHLSPDCTDFSKAKGAKPLRDTRRRSLAWVGLAWAGTVHPRVITLENVEEFLGWGPLVGSPGHLRPCKLRRGKRFRRFVWELAKLGYEVQWQERRACDWGAATIRKRLYLIARCDGLDIVWPEPTHGAPKSRAVLAGKLKRWREAGEYIDWRIPMLSIFATREEAKAWGKLHGQAAPQRPLAGNSNKRIARGVRKFVLDSRDPYLVLIDNEKGTYTPYSVTVAHGEESPSGKRRGGGVRSLSEPHTTITGKGDVAVVAPYLIPRYGERDGQAPRSRSLRDPLPTIVPDGNGAQIVAPHLSTYYGGEDAKGQRLGSMSEPLRTQGTENRHAVCAAFLAQQNGGFFDGEGRGLDEPLSTVLSSSRGHHALLASTLIKLRGTSSIADPAAPLDTISAGGQHHGLAAAHVVRDFGASVGSDAGDPLGTITAGANGHAGVIAAFLDEYYGNGQAQSLSDPLHTVTPVDRFGFVSVQIAGEPMYIRDICMRMLQPRELYLCQGFPPDYIIDIGQFGRVLTKSEQVHMCGNSVSPPPMAAIIEANCDWMIAREELTA